MSGRLHNLAGTDAPAASARAEALRWGKPELRALADAAGRGEARAIAVCVAFVALETRGHWHNRARALMCRRLKHCPLSDEQGERVLAAILARLVGGDFTEQFRDQLRLALRLDRARTLAAARAALGSPRTHVHRLAQWVVAHGVPR